VNKFKVYNRPFLDSFVQMCQEKFHLAVWSSAMKHNVLGMVKALFGEGYESVLEVVMDRSDCTMTGIMHPLEVHKPVVIKELSRAWRHPALRGRFDVSNTLLIDDSPHKAALNHAFTTLSPPPWTADQTDDRCLAPGSQLSRFLVGLADAPDVAGYLKEHNPFPEAAKLSMEVDLTARIQASLARRAKDKTNHKDEEAEAADEGCLSALRNLKVSDRPPSPSAAVTTATTTSSSSVHKQHRQGCASGADREKGTGARHRDASSVRTRTDSRGAQHPSTASKNSTMSERSYHQGRSERISSVGQARQVALCRNWEASGSCRFGQYCRFVHAGAAGSKQAQSMRGTCEDESCSS